MAEKLLNLDGAGKRGSKLPISKVKELLDRFAERVYVDRYMDELRSFLEERVDHETRGMSSQEFRSLKPRIGRQFASFSGPCVVQSDYDAEEQQRLIYQVIGKYDAIDAVVHGATHWGFIAPLHQKAVASKRLSIGIMPWQGLWDLAQIADKLPPDFPKMHYLGIEGLTYGHHAGLFGELSDFCILLGGRRGAYLEASAVGRQRGKQVLCYDLEGGSEAVRKIEGGKVVLPTVKDIVNFLNANMRPDQRQFIGQTMDFEEFDRYLMSRGVVNVGFVSTSGGFTNCPAVRNLLDDLLRRGIPTEIADRVEFTSGGTRFGGVWEIYNTLKDLNIGRNGVISSKGLTNPWADVDRMVYTGKNWGMSRQISYMCLMSCWPTEAAHKRSRKSQKRHPVAEDTHNSKGVYQL